MVLRKHYLGDKVLTDKMFAHQMKALGWERQHVTLDQDRSRTRLWMTNIALDDQPSISESFDL